MHSDHFSSELDRDQKYSNRLRLERDNDYSPASVLRQDPMEDDPAVDKLEQGMERALLFLVLPLESDAEYSMLVDGR